MTALKPTGIHGTITWLGVVGKTEHEEGRDSIRSCGAQTLELTFAGPVGEFHEGEVRLYHIRDERKPVLVHATKKSSLCLPIMPKPPAHACHSHRLMFKSFTKCVKGTPLKYEP